MISKALLAVLTIILVTILLFGCANQQSATIGQTTTSPTNSTSTTSIDDRPYIIDTTITLSAAPKMGETADLTFTVDVIKLDEQTHPAAGLANSKAWLEFYWTNTNGSYSEAYSSVRIPLEEVLVSGEFPWEGSYSKGFTLQSKIKLPREGIWTISGGFTAEGWSYGTGRSIRVAVADGTAAIMDTEDFHNGPLGYLEYFTYGRGGGPIVPDEIYPVSVGLDISKAPRAGEEVTLSCRIVSLINVSDLSIQWYFSRRLGDDIEEVPATELLSSADLGWKTDVKKDEPVVFSTTIKFPTEGDWEITAVAESGTKPLMGSGHSMHICITPTTSYYGWINIIPPGTGKPPDTTPGTTKAIY